MHSSSSMEQHGRKQLWNLFPWKQSSHRFIKIVSIDNWRVPAAYPCLHSYHHSNKTKKMNKKAFYLANKDKSLPTRPFAAFTELFNKFIHEVYHEGWCWSHVQLFNHFTNLEEMRRKKIIQKLLLITNPQKLEICDLLRLLYQLVRNPTDRRHFVCTEAESNRSQVVINVSGTVQI